MSFATIARDVDTSVQQPVTFDSSQLASGSSVSISIPYNSLRMLNSAQTVRVTHTVYFDDKLFQDSRPIQLISTVLATSVVNSVGLNNLSEPIILQFSKASQWVVNYVSELFQLCRMKMIVDQTQSVSFGTFQGMVTSVIIVSTSIFIVYVLV